MPDAKLNAYLAARYLDGPKAEAMLARAGVEAGEDKKRRKKRKKETAAGASAQSGAGTGFKLVDDEDGWKRAGEDDDDDDGEEGRAVVVQADGAGGSKGRAKWARLGAGDAMADEAEGQVESNEGKGEEGMDEVPQVAGADGLALDADAQAQVGRRLQEQEASGGGGGGGGGGEGSASASASASGGRGKERIKAGLKTREEMRAERLERERLAAEEAAKGVDARAEEQARRAQEKEREREAAQQQTVYRDSSGRKIDVEEEKRQRERQEREQQRLEREKKDWNKGEAQLRRAREERKREEEMKETAFARYSSDEKMNAELKAVERASDPALAFLTKKKREKGPSKPVYKGSFPPNRFGIRPGYRWDGVERSNGFEKKLFQRQNERRRAEADAQAWRQEDM